MRVILACLICVALAGCSAGMAGTLLYCLAVDHDTNRKCQ